MRLTIWGGNKMRINKLEIAISAILTVVFGLASALTYGNETVFNVAIILTELSLFAFMAMHITYICPEKKFGRA